MTCTEELMAAEKYASPPGAVLVIIHQMKLMLAWWYTCRSVTYAARAGRVSAIQRAASGSGQAAARAWCRLPLSSMMKVSMNS